ncbi:hypothetical protein [Lentibacter sp. XHP0401]|nr:hypothetical protein [Lentibacter sp. XHP0401]MCV2892085.1 hypothetical protein [Lentibacter sp. XHP0401]
MTCRAILDSAAEWSLEVETLDAAALREVAKGLRRPDEGMQKEAVNE